MVGSWEYVGLKGLFDTTEFVRGVKRYVSGVKEVNTATERTARSVSRSAKDMSVMMEGAVTSMAVQMVTVAGFYKAITSSIALANEAARSQNIEQSFYILAASSGVAADELVTNMQRASEGTVDSMRIMQIANRAMLAGGKEFASALPQLMEIARSASLATGKDFDYVFDTLVTGIAKSSPLLIDNAEIYVKVGQAVEEVAKKSNRTTEELSSQERQLAVLNAVLEQGGTYTERLGKNLDDQTKYMQAASVSTTELKRNLGDGLLPIVQGVSAVYTDVFVPAIQWGTTVLTHAIQGTLSLASSAVVFAETLYRTRSITQASTAATEEFDASMRSLIHTIDTSGIAAAPVIPEPPPDLATRYKKAVDIVQTAVDRIQSLQSSHYLALARMEADANRARVRAEQDYYRSVEKAQRAGQKSLDKLARQYEKQRAKTIADYNRRIAEAEQSAYKDVERQRRDIERQERYARERFQLDQIQNERRYQFERGRLIAEGDTLAIEELDARYRLEQQEREENEGLRQRQGAESQADQIREAGEAARQQIEELRRALDEQLAEQDESYREQIDEQRQANEERMAEMAEAFQLQQQLKAEDDALARQRAEENYRQQLEDLGRSLADQLREQGISAEQISTILQQYYGQDGIADTIMQGWHDRERTRIEITADAFLQLAATITAAWEEVQAAATGIIPTQRIGPIRSGGGPMIPTMDEGGVVVGPQTVRVGAGMVEQFIPLGRIGGNVSHNWSGGPIPVSGLEGATPSSQSEFARAFAEQALQFVRTRRRS